MVDPFFKRGTIGSRGKFTPRFWKGPLIEEEQCRSNDQFLTLAKTLEGSGRMPIESTCALWTWRRHMTEFPRHVLREVLWQYGARGALIKAI